MRIQEVTIHNFRSIEHQTIRMKDFTLVAGENNAGKTNLITALRTFYEDGGAKYNEKKDFPKFSTEDDESWIEIEYRLESDELASLKDEYKGLDSTLRVRRYFKANDKSLVEAKQSNIYAYENGQLSTTLFYGFKNVAGGKLGEVIYIPEMAKSSDTLKLSGPSPLRDIANFVFKKVVANSKSFQRLNESVAALNQEFHAKSSDDVFNLNGLVKDINRELNLWDIDFGFRINDVKPEDIVKNLLEHFIRDRNLNDEEIDVDNLGQGLQRHIIYTLIRLSAKYVDKATPKKKDFSPQLTLILFEEPEAFLHPTQQEALNRSLHTLIKESQILITTHSPIYVSRNICDIPSIIRVNKREGRSEVFQISDEDLACLHDANVGLYKHLSHLLANSSVAEEVKRNIKKNHLGDENPDMAKKVDEESFRYSLWLDAERSSAIFAKNIIICEGATEKAVLDYLLENRWDDLARENLYIFDSLGKYNIHRFMGFFGALGIPHCVLYDGDSDRNVQKYVNDFVESKKNKFTIAIDHFPADFESELGITLPRSNHLKPLNALKAIDDGSVSDTVIQSLKERLSKMLQGAV